VRSWAGKESWTIHILQSAELTAYRSRMLETTGLRLALYRTVIYSRVSRWQVCARRTWSRAHHAGSPTWWSCRRWPAWGRWACFWQQSQLAASDRSPDAEICWAAVGDPSSSTGLSPAIIAIINTRVGDQLKCRIIVHDERNQCSAQCALYVNEVSHILILPVRLSIHPS